MSKIARYVKVGYAALTGDKERLLILQNASKAEAAIEKQLSKLKYELLDRNEALKEAEDAYEKATIVTEYKITDAEDYLRGIRSAQENVDKAKAGVAEVNRSTEYFTKVLANITEQVDE